MTASVSHPQWLSPKLYPFESKFIRLPVGKMHYLDEGTGVPLVFVHGVPTWSFEYRRLIMEMRSDHRCIAMDHIGFGLSDKPRDFPHTPAHHVDNLRLLLDQLSVDHALLIVHDFGGPIGLRWAEEHADRVVGIFLMNTWMCPPLKGLRSALFRQVMTSKLTRILDEQFNLVTRTTFAGFDKEIRKHYIGPFEDKRDRIANWGLGQSVGTEREWFEQLWESRRAIADKKTGILWGKNDPSLTMPYLNKLKEVWPDAHVRLVNASHFVAEEMPEVATAELRKLARVVFHS